MFKWFFLRDDCDILRNLFLEHHMFANEGSIHSNNSRRMNAVAAFSRFIFELRHKVFYLGLPRHNVLSCSSHRCLAQGEVRTFVTMCFVVRSSICKLLHIFFFTYFAVRSCIYIFLTCFVVRSSIYIFCALMLLIWVWNFR